ncbi:patatin-like phospholipase family protein [Nocardia grenadensis]
MTTAFVLWGGGSLGAAQVGMLRALTKRGMRAYVVVGASIGALNGSTPLGPTPRASKPSPGHTREPGGCGPRRRPPPDALR